MPPSTLRRRLTWIVLVLCLGLNLVFVTMQGAWTSDLGGDPDEAAHAVTSLMVSDFLTGGWRQSPMSFANRYYADFPKVALGHYPPGYYLLSGLWLTPHPSIKSFLVLQALLSALTGALLYRLASKIVSLPAAMMAGILSSALPLALEQIQLVMSDTMLALLCVLAAVSWRDYMNHSTCRRALGFGFIATAAILTKGSAIGLAAIPLVATVLSCRLELLKKPSWWLSALPVAVLAGPWMLFSAKITADGMSNQPLSEFFRDAVSFYMKTLPQSLGWPLLVLSAGGAFALLILAVKSPRRPEASALIGLLIGMTAVMLMVPAGLNSRYILPILPVLLTAAVFAADKLSAITPRHRSLAAVCIVVAAYVPAASWPKKSVHGFTAAVQRSNAPLPTTQPERWLVASDPRGEGAIIAAAAFACPQRSPSVLRVYRASKELASSDWMGRGYQPAFTNDSGLLSHLDKLQIQRVFMDLSVPDGRQTLHEVQLLAALQSAKDRWHLDFEQPITRRPRETGVLRVYRRIFPTTSNSPN